VLRIDVIELVDYFARDITRISVRNTEQASKEPQTLLGNE
jgi:hypothetical protein